MAPIKPFNSKSRIMNEQQRKTKLNPAGNVQKDLAFCLALGIYNGIMCIPTALGQDPTHPTLQL